MAQLNITLSQDELLQLLAGNREEAFKKLVEKILNQALQAESMDQLNADQYERSNERTDYRNGTRERELTTRLGTITLVVPRHRNKPFHTVLFENYKRSETALLATMAEMVVMGVSSRKVGDVLEKICGKDFSKSAVSDVCKRLDPDIAAFRNRSLKDHNYPFVMVDATYFKVRENHKIISKCIMIAIGYTEIGEREVLYFSTADNESTETWLAFFEQLKSNGLNAPLMITSDSHQAIRHAIAKVYPTTPWQRCQFHFTRNLLDAVPKKYQSEFHGALRNMFDSVSLPEARKTRDQIIKDYCGVAEKATRLLDEGFEDAMSVYALPATIRKQIRTSNMLERLNRELKRRSDVIKIFPNENSLLRLMGAVIIEEHEKMSSEKVRFTHFAFDKITPAVQVELQNLALNQWKSLRAA